jgi:hypothetical protein
MLVLELELELPPPEDVWVEPGLVAVFAGAAAVDTELLERLFLIRNGMFRHLIFDKKIIQNTNL